MEDEGLEYPFTADFSARDLQQALEIYFDTHICYKKLQQRTVGFKACFFHVQVWRKLSAAFCPAAHLKQSKSVNSR